MDPLKHKKNYTDEELKDILSHSPTKENIRRLAEKYGRSENAMREIYRWSNYSQEKIKQKKKWNTFTKQIKKCCVELGLMKLP